MLLGEPVLERRKARRIERRVLRHVPQRVRGQLNSARDLAPPVLRGQDRQVPARRCLRVVAGLAALAKDGERRVVRDERRGSRRQPDVELRGDGIITDESEHAVDGAVAGLVCHEHREERRARRIEACDLRLEGPARGHDATVARERLGAREVGGVRAVESVREVAVRAVIGRGGPRQVGATFRQGRDAESGVGDDRRFHVARLDRDGLVGDAAGRNRNRVDTLRARDLIGAGHGHLQRERRPDRLPAERDRVATFAEAFAREGGTGAVCNGDFVFAEDVGGGRREARIEPADQSRLLAGVQRGAHRHVTRCRRFEEGRGA